MNPVNKLNHHLEMTQEFDKTFMFMSVLGTNKDRTTPKDLLLNYP